MPPQKKVSVRRVIAASTLGNFIEFYDFTIYGTMAAVTSKVFFPSGSVATSLLATFATFAVAFALRPIGGILFGHLGDAVSRRASLTIVVGMTSGGTFAIGLLPSQAAAGLLAPILLVTCRCIQGLGAGGELPSSTAFVLEHTPANRKGFYTGLQGSSAFFGLVGGAAVALLVSKSMGMDQLLSWGWRIPFLIAGPLGLVALYVRFRTPETETFSSLKESGNLARVPILEVLRQYRPQVFLVFIIAVAHVSASYFVSSFVVTYLVDFAHRSLNFALGTNLIALILGGTIAVFVSWLSDRVGRRPLLLVGLAANIVLAVPAFLLLGVSGLIVVLLGEFLLTLGPGVTNGIVPIIQTEIFPAHVRVSGVALAYNMATIVGGSTTPFIATLILTASGVAVGPFIYLIALSAIAFGFAAWRLPETRQSPHTAEYAPGVLATDS